MSAAPHIQGHCDPRFTRVAQAFANNFVENKEPGAAIALMVGGLSVVDLWGGHADAARTKPWARDTLVNFFSVGKALSALVVLRLVERGRIDLDAPVAALWPEFAANGKDAISTRHVLTHQSALPAIAEPMPDGAALDHPRMVAALERQEPWWVPGAEHGYHVNTYGFLVGEIVRRASGETLGTLLKRDIAGPLGADVHIGLAQSEHARCAEFLWPALGVMPRPDNPSREELMRWSAYWNPPGISGAGWVNRAEWRSAEIPSTNGHGTARGVARIYAALADGGEIDATRIVSRAMLDEATRPYSDGFDLVTQRPSRFGLGFQLTQPERPLGPNARAFGHFGAGGSLGFCDPETRVAFAYVTNDMGPRWQNPRNRALIEAIYASL
jgi:CubicO group peptidase (beta-lactamase class C family)